MNEEEENKEDVKSLGSLSHHVPNIYKASLWERAGQCLDEHS